MKDAAVTGVALLLSLLGVVLLLPAVSWAQQPPALGPECPIVDPPADQWLRWSDPRTWPSQVVPQLGDEVLIPCNTAVLLDVSPPALSGLWIKGQLKLLDGPSAPDEIDVVTNWVIVQGKLTIGTPTQQYSRKVTFTLTPAPGRQQKTFFYPAGNLVVIGHKAFYVLGGQIGDDIAIAPSDFDFNEAEQFTIVDIKRIIPTSNHAIVTLDGKLRYKHFGNRIVVPADNNNNSTYSFYEDTQVGLLTRNIVIRGVEESGDYALEGGHLVVAYTSTPQYIEGVELISMGQQGNIGRYPMHMHQCGYHPDTYIRGNAVHHSFQRGVVIHGTHDVDVRSNVLYNIQGHGYFLEDGVETGNVFTNNLAIYIVSVTKLISEEETDDEPSAFWMSNLDNTWTNNVAAGCEAIGYWMELRNAVRGESAARPEAKGMVPREIPLRLFKGNTAHATGWGLRTYPSGYFGPESTIYNFLAFKNRISGVFFHKTRNFRVFGSRFLDNAVGVDIDRAGDINVAWSYFVATTPNDPYGCLNFTTKDPANPNTCVYTRNSVCQPTYHSVTNVASYYGVSMHCNNAYPDAGARLENNVYFGFKHLCKPMAAIYADPTTLGDNPQAVWETRTQIYKQTFISSLPLSIQHGTNADFGFEAYNQFTLWDTDGSIMQQSGYLTSGNNVGLVDTRRCTPPKDDINAYACPGACYRQVQVRFVESAPDIYSTVTVSGRRGQYYALKGGYYTTGNSINDKNHVFYAAIQSATTYTFNILSTYPTRTPTQVGIYLSDSDTAAWGEENCGSFVDIILPAPRAGYRFVPLSGPIVADFCPGTSEDKWPDGFAVYSYTCVNNRWVMRMRAGRYMSGEVWLTQVPGDVCQAMKTCTGFQGRSVWKYLDDGSDAITAGFMKPTYDDTRWKSGPALLGFGPYAVKQTYVRFSTATRPQIASWFFRRTFSIKSAACVIGFHIGHKLSHGAIIYINGIEIFRYYLPPGPITYLTFAEGARYVTDASPYTPVTLNNAIPYLVDGNNVVAVELHMNYRLASAFDMLLNLDIKC
eukprot:jgi/Chlat1/1154/Chrsp112S01614